MFDDCIVVDREQLAVLVQVGDMKGDVFQSVQLFDEFVELVEFHRTFSVQFESTKFSTELNGSDDQRENQRHETRPTLLFTSSSDNMINLNDNNDHRVRWFTHRTNKYLFCFPIGRRAWRHLPSLNKS
jgi:hypothetical protein